MIRITAWSHADEPPERLDADAFEISAANPWRLIWIDLEGDDAAGHRRFMQEQLGLPRLAVDDALRQRHPPKYEELDDGWCFQLMRGFDADTPSTAIGTVQLALFWRGNLVVSRHDKPSASVMDTRQSLDDGTMAAPESASRLLYAIQRKILDRYMPILLKIEARLERIEELLLKRPDDRLLAELMEFSSQLKRLRRVSAYHEKSLASLRSHDPVRHGMDGAHLTDLFEQAERLQSLTTLLYEITTDVINGYLSVSSHRLNNVMRVLTVVTVLFVPLTFIAGVYGMNFVHMPELASRWGYFIVLGVMVLIATTLLVLFRRKGWI
jgi:magnesium transporter